MLGDLSVRVSNEDGDPAIPVGSFGVGDSDFEFPIAWNLDLVGDLLLAFSCGSIMNVIVGDKPGV